jgi:hypothetical protein
MAFITTWGKRAFAGNSKHFSYRSFKILNPKIHPFLIFFEGMGSISKSVT